MAADNLSSGRIRSALEATINSISFADKSELVLFMADSKKKKKLAKFRCNLCGSVVQRDAKRTWIKSYCLFFGSSSRLYRVSEKGK
jgi:hypothetical protein